ncbi:MAG TPA: hypothetical protein VJ648_01290 [Vicinamibacteria bacterium]|nr:hypothetical protein [Vicinamibacteria bacterium]
MSEVPAAGRVVIRFGAERVLGAAAVVALEDYARELTQASAAEALVAEGDTGRLTGMALDAPRIAPQGAVLEDIEAFARELSERAPPGLGWS